ncbi:MULTISPECIES: metal-dependent hydrolase [unclassified Methanoregula]|uniref:metal-dependent hydrolase n=1 Tax=unclassified Methanoregula TaxID=2649730 RepID=UPI0009C73DC4|nr:MULTISPECIES: metal-dependent hydrolase [unclassified Methanoregula]OPX64664.1 MAG: hypothetical protein A4E33_00749 [Methanoregula sp. PtaB.Bin085]OPY36032.1 MAG: hypothetical protein A4E34_00437 [Methanoregula sp. PtaU1.Bin006]
MYLFAHLFTGLLVGLGFFSLCNDRRLVPVCVAGSLFPDLLDKTLVFLIPGLIGSTRTIGHTLLFAGVTALAALIVWHRYRSIIGIAFAGTVLVHQLLDLMWTQPVTWFFPLHGMFPFVPVTGGFLQFLVMELTNPSEWVFGLASAFIVLGGCAGLPGPGSSSLSGRSTAIMQYGVACLLGITGAWLIMTGMDPVSATGTVLYAGPDKTLVAGVVALSGAIVLFLVPSLKRQVFL